MNHGYMNCSEEDSKWVKEVFDYVEAPIFKFGMELRPGFQFYEHSRDLVPGTNSTERIIRAIERSRRMIVIISR